jgi:hypothetical protein
MVRPRDDPPPGSPQYKRLKWDSDAALRQRPATLGQLRSGNNPWMWATCRNLNCNRGAPVALVPYIIRWGTDAPIETMINAMRCELCGFKGVSLDYRNWADAQVGLAPWPNGFRLGAPAPYRGWGVESGTRPASSRRVS